MSTERFLPSLANGSLMGNYPYYWYGPAGNSRHKLPVAIGPAALAWAKQTGDRLHAMGYPVYVPEDGSMGPTLDDWADFVIEGRQYYPDYPWPGTLPDSNFQTGWASAENFDTLMDTEDEERTKEDLRPGWRFQQEMSTPGQPGFPGPWDWNQLIRGVHVRTFYRVKLCLQMAKITHFGYGGGRPRRILSP